MKLTTLDRFREINSTFPKTAQVMEFKKQGKKVFGWMCTYVPEEIIHAAGALPIRIVGYSQEMELEDGNAYLYINNCSFSRSCLQLGLRGGYDFLDGVIGGSTCDGVRRLFDLWRVYLPAHYNHILNVPRKYTEKAHELYYTEIAKFKESFEQFIGQKISDDALLHSIGVYNESRTLLARLYELRKLPAPPITGAETLEVLNASFRMPRELYIQYLKQLLDEIAVSGNAHSARARIILTGSILTNPEFVAFIEKQGALVVTDELCTSTRYWSDPVVLDVTTTPLRAIAHRYLSNFPCARMVPSEERFRRIVELAQDFKVDGMISQIIRYCVQYAHDLPMLSQRLKEHDIPTLSLDVEYGSSGSGQILTRVQAFLEMLEARKK